MTNAKKPKEEKPEAQVILSFYPNATKALLIGAGRLTPRRIQRAMPVVYREYRSFIAQERQKHHTAEQEAREREAKELKDAS